MKETEKRRLIVGVSGASGAPLAVDVLRTLRGLGVETHLVLTRGAVLTLAQETDLTLPQCKALADAVYENTDLGAAIASGSFRTMGMLVVPCSMKTVAGIHSGYSENLLLRAADVTLKERRPLVLCPRECPLSPIHLRNMYELSMLGVRVLPPVLSYYSRPGTVAELTHHITGKLLDCFGLDTPGFVRWEG